MNVGDPITTPPSLVDRIKNILLKPKEEWPRIDVEPATVGSIFTSYVLILAAIPALAFLIGAVAFGFTLPFLGTLRLPVTSIVSIAITQYVMSLISVFVLSIIIDWLAPSFGGVKNSVQATKVAAYSYTAAWVAGIFSIVPQLSILGLLGLYSVYLLYLGLPLLMKTPADKTPGYFAVTVIAAVVVLVIIHALSAPITSMFVTPATVASTSGTMTVPGVGSVDLGKMEAASRQMEAAAKSMQNAAATGTAGSAVAPGALQALLPESIGGYRRTEVESQSMAAGGMGGSHAEAKYEAGEKHFQVEVTDMAVAGALAAMGAAMNVQSNRQTATGYEKTETINGRLVTEEWDKSDSSGSYSTTIANRFMVKATGTVASIDDLKAAVAAIGPDKLASLAN